MSIINTPTTDSVEGVVGTDSGNQRVVMVNPIVGTQSGYSTKSVECVVEDEGGNKQRCVCVTHFSDAESSPIPDQTGHGGQFLKTTGSSLVWDDVVQNSGTGSLALGLGGADADGDGAIGIGSGSESSGASSISVGISSEATGDDSIVIGGIAKDNGNNYNTVIGGRSTSTKNGSTIVGYNASSTAIGGIAIGLGASATENGTLNIGLSTNGNTGTSYKLLNSDGTIPAIRLGSLPNNDGNYRLRLTISSGVPTLSWVAE